MTGELTDETICLACEEKLRQDVFGTDEYAESDQEYAARLGRELEEHKSHDARLTTAFIAGALGISPMPRLPRLRRPEPTPEDKHGNERANAAEERRARRAAKKVRDELRTRAGKLKPISIEFVPLLTHDNADPLHLVIDEIQGAMGVPEELMKGMASGLNLPAEFWEAPMVKPGEIPCFTKLQTYGIDWRTPEEKQRELQPYQKEILEHFQTDDTIRILK